MLSDHWQTAQAMQFQSLERRSVEYYVLAVEQFFRYNGFCVHAQNIFCRKLNVERRVQSQNDGLQHSEVLDLR